MPAFDAGAGSFPSILMTLRGPPAWAKAWAPQAASEPHKANLRQSLNKERIVFHGPSNRLFACFVKNLAEAVAYQEIFPGLHGHRDNLQMIRTLSPLHDTGPGSAHANCALVNSRTLKRLVVESFFQRERKYWHDFTCLLNAVNRKSAGFRPKTTEVKVWSVQIEVQQAGLSKFESGLHRAQQRSVFATKAEAQSNAARIMFLKLKLA